MAGKRKSGRNYAGQYCIEEIDFWFTDPRIKGFPMAKLLLFYMDMACVKERRETLPVFWTISIFAGLVGCDTRTAQKAYNRLLQKCLVKTEDDGRLTVCGVKRRHQNLRWKDGEYTEPNADANGAQAVSDKRLRDETRAVGAVSRVGSVPPDDWMDEVLAKKVNANQS